MTNDSDGKKLLPYQQLVALRETGALHRLDSPIALQQFGPCSLDLTLGSFVHRIRASFLGSQPANRVELLKHFTMHTMDMTAAGVVLEKGCVYLIPLREQLSLPDQIAALANTRSTAGRLGIFTRLVIRSSEQNKREDIKAAMLNYDQVPSGYRGNLWLEVCATCFSVKVKQGDSLNHLRFYDLSQTQTRRHKPTPLTLDLAANRQNQPVGFLARQHTSMIDYSALEAYEPRWFWQPVYPEKNGIILSPGDFYILRTKNRVTIAAEQAGYLRSYHAPVGEFRLHYAAFLDAGFGSHTAGEGASVILEVKGNEVPFFLEDGQISGYLEYEELVEATTKPYGSGVSRPYVNTGLQLARQFKPWHEKASVA